MTITELFFVITGTAVIIITVMVVIGLIYVIMFVRTIKTVARTAQRATEIVSEDLGELRDSIKDKGVSMGAFTKFAKNIGRKRILPKK
jgi:hypothetical protein